MKTPCMRSTQVIQAVSPSVGSKRQPRVFGHRPCVKTQWRQSSAKGSLGSQLTTSHRVRYWHVCATLIASSPDVQTKRDVAEKLAWVQTTNMVSLLLLHNFASRTRSALVQTYAGNAVTLVQAALTSAVESGINTFLFPAQHQHLAQEWKGIVDFDALLCDGDAIHADNQQVFCHC